MKAYQYDKFYKFSRSGDLNIRKDLVLALALALAGLHLSLHLAHVSGLYCKHITIVNDDSSIINKSRYSLTDADRVTIYDCLLFIVQS
jgi:hypothetical protein